MESIAYLYFGGALKLDQVQAVAELCLEAYFLSFQSHVADVGEVVFAGETVLRKGWKSEICTDGLAGVLRDERTLQNLYMSTMETFTLPFINKVDAYWHPYNGRVT